MKKVLGAFIFLNCLGKDSYFGNVKAAKTNPPKTPTTPIAAANPSALTQVTTETTERHESVSPQMQNFKPIKHSPPFLFQTATTESKLLLPLAEAIASTENY